METVECDCDTNRDKLEAPLTSTPVLPHHCRPCRIARVQILNHRSEQCDPSELDKIFHDAPKTWDPSLISQKNKNKGPDEWQFTELESIMYASEPNSVVVKG